MIINGLGMREISAEEARKIGAPACHAEPKGALLDRLRVMCGIHPAAC